MHDGDTEATKIFDRCVGISATVQKISDDELHDDLIDAYGLIEDILNGVAYCLWDAIYFFCHRQTSNACFVNMGLFDGYAIR